MKMTLYFAILIFSSGAAAENIQKWVDETGKVHYGNVKNAVKSDSTETLKVIDSFDQKEYDAGVARHKNNEKVGAKYDKERATEARKKKLEEKKRQEKLQSQKPRNSGRITNPYSRPAIRR